jgi:phosphoribosylglycinamide formyltransferase-1
VALSPEDTVDDIAEKEHQLEMKYLPGVIEELIVKAPL